MSASRRASSSTGRRGRERRGSSLRERRGDRPLYILYTSERPGSEGVVRDHGGHAVALHWSMRNVYGVEPGDVFWAASTSVGRRPLVHRLWPLAARPPTVLYEAKPVGTPDAGAFWRVVAEHGVQVLFTAPTSLRAIRREDPRASTCALRRADARHLFLAASASIRTRTTGRPICSAFPSSTIVADRDGWPVAANCVGLGALPLNRVSHQAVPGCGFRVLDPDGTPSSRHRRDVVELPMPPGALSTLWRTTTGSCLLPVPLPGHT